MRELHAETSIRLARRANLLVSGVPSTRPAAASADRKRSALSIGGETTPCERMDEALPGLQASDGRPWAGGAFAQIRVSGAVRVGFHPIIWL